MQRYVSKELFHFVGRKLGEEQQYELLVRIAGSGWLTHPPHSLHVTGNLTVNSGARLSRNEMYATQIVCFCDIPFQDLGIHVRKYSRFGMSFPKDLVVAQGGAPVFYIPLEALARVVRNVPDDHAQAMSFMKRIQSEGPMAAFESLGAGEYFDKMAPEYHELFRLFQQRLRETSTTPGVSVDEKRLWELQRFFDFHVFSFVKFFDHRLPDDHPDNYYFEREWRLVGNLQFELGDIRTIVVPRSYAERLAADLPEYSGQRLLLD